MSALDRQREMRARHHLALLWGFLLLASASCQQGLTVVKTAQQALLQRVMSNPDADPFQTLAADVKTMWSRAPDLTINQTIMQLLAIPVKPLIEVRLVGFDGTGYGRVRLQDRRILTYLHSLQADMDTAVLEPELGFLSVYPEFRWLVRHDAMGLSGTLAQAVRSGVQSAKEKGSVAMHGGPLYIPAQTVDRHIAASSRDGQALLTVYLLNLDVEPSVQYAYTYMSGDESSAGFCPGTHYVGASTAPNPRYVWIDITAGPVSYGCGSRGKGHVFDHSLPHPAKYHSNHMEAILAPELVSLVWSAVQHLAWPPLQQVEGVKASSKLIVQVIHMHEALAHTSERVSRDALHAALAPVLGNNMALEIHETWVPMAGCSLCVDAYVSSVRAGRDDSSPVLMAFESRFLDQATLVALMRRYRDGIYGHAGIVADVEPGARVLPVFVWDVTPLPRDAVLFEGGHQAVAYPDMVLAVASSAGPAYTPATCGFSQVVMDPGDPTRAVIAGVLQSVFGVANTTTFYTPATGPGPNYLWTLSNTPFGVLSSAKQLSGPLASTIPRNLALAHLNASVLQAATLLAGLAQRSKGGGFDADACGEFRGRILQRVNLILYKVHQAASRMTTGDFWTAVAFVRSLPHDVAHLRRLAVRVAKAADAQLNCVSGPTLSSVWWAPLLALLTWPVAWLLRTRLYRRKFDKLY